MTKVEIQFFDLDSNKFVEVEPEQFEKENPSFILDKIVSSIIQSKEEFLVFNGIQKRVLEVILENDGSKYTFKFQDVFESIYKKY
jgi:hypothetical protein